MQRLRPLILGILAILLIAGCDEAVNEPEAPSKSTETRQQALEEDPDYEPSVTYSGPWSWTFPDTYLGTVLKNYFAVQMGSGEGEDSTTNYNNALSELHEMNDQAIPVLSQEYNEVPTEKQMLRWRIVEAIGAIKSDDGIPVLLDIAKEPVQTINAENRFQVRGEIRIRLIAVHGIGSHAYLTGSTEAEDALIEILQDQDNQVVQSGVVSELVHLGYSNSELIDIAEATERTWIIDRLEQPEIDLHEGSEEWDLEDSEPSSEEQWDFQGTLEEEPQPAE